MPTIREPKLECPGCGFRYGVLMPKICPECGFDLAAALREEFCKAGKKAERWSRKYYDFIEEAHRQAGRSKLIFRQEISFENPGPKPLSFFGERSFFIIRCVYKFFRTVFVV